MTNKNGVMEDQVKTEQEIAAKKVAFLEAYQALCNEYGCEILGSPALTHDGRLTCQLTVQVR